MRGLASHRPSRWSDDEFARAAVAAGGRQVVLVGLDTLAATAWIAEGVLMYLSTEQNERLLSQVGELSAPGSRRPGRTGYAA